MDNWLPHCINCGRFVNPTKPGASGRLRIGPDYWNGPECEDVRCAQCTDRLGPMQPSSGCKSDTAWSTPPQKKTT